MCLCLYCEMYLESLEDNSVAFAPILQMASNIGTLCGNLIGALLRTV